MDRMQKLIKKGQIEEKREQISELQIKVDRLIKDIYYYLHMVDGVEGLKINHASQAMAELEEAVRQYKGVSTELKELSEDG